VVVVEERLVDPLGRFSGTLAILHQRQVPTMKLATHRVARFGDAGVRQDRVEEYLLGQSPAPCNFNE
jgi:hypothetical protein